MNFIEKVGYKVSFIAKMLTYRVCYRRSFYAGKNLSFRRGFTVNINENGVLRIGSDVFFNNDCSINCREHISIGDKCIFGENVKIYDHNHRFSKFESPILDQGYTTRQVSIGDNCWIGSNVVILPGSIIHSNSIIGAGCIISGEIPDGVIVTSNRELQFVKRKRNGK